MRPLLALLLSVSLFNSVLAEARANDSAIDTRSVLETTVERNALALQSFKGLDGNAASEELDQVLAKSNPELRTKLIGGFGSIVVFTIVMLGVANVGRLNGIPKQLPSGPQLLNASKEAASQLVSLSALTAMLAVGSKAMQKPLQVLLLLATNPKTAPLLREVIAHSITNTVMLGAIESWDELYSMAQYVSQQQSGLNKDEIQRTQDIVRLGAGSLASLISSDKGYAIDRHVAAVLARNMFLVSVGNPELMNQWLSNVWRKRILTGEFAAMVSTMTAGAAIGSLIPGAGTFTVSMFTGAGLMASYFLPQSWKDKVTTGAQRARFDFINSSLKTDAANLISATQTSEYVPPMRLGLVGKGQPPADFKTLNPSAGGMGSVVDVPPETRLGVFNVRWAARRALRESFATLMFERMHMTNAHLQRSTLKVDDAAKRLNQYFQAITAMYQSDQQLLLQVATQDQDRTPGLLAQLQIDSAELGLFVKFVSDSQGILIESLDELGSTYDVEALPHDALNVMKFIEITYQRGFFENEILHPPQRHGPKVANSSY